MSLVLFVMLPAVLWAGQKTTRIYDAQGHYVGRTRENDVNIQIYDKNGRYQGRVTKNPDGTKTVWSNDGKYMGRMKTEGGDEDQSE